MRNVILAVPPFRDGSVCPGCCPVLWGWNTGGAARGSAFGKGERAFLVLRGQGWPLEGTASWEMGALFSSALHRGHFPGKQAWTVSPTPVGERAPPPGTACAGSHTDLTGLSVVCFENTTRHGVRAVSLSIRRESVLHLRVLWEQFSPAASRLLLCLQPVKSSVRYNIYPF